MHGVSVIIPAYNEAGAVAETVHRVRQAFLPTGRPFEILVVDDGSADTTAAEAEAAGAIVLRHPANIGYGNAIMTGVQHAAYDLIALTDADGTYPVDQLPSMVEELDARGLDMLVGARQGKFYQGSRVKAAARVLFKFLAEFASGTRIPDINSGLRVFRRGLVEQFHPVLCGGFSFTTTMTVIALLTHHFVAYRPVPYYKRHGSSKVHYLRDTLRAAQILTMAILIFNPIKLYILLAGAALGTCLALTMTALAFPGLWPACLLAGLTLSTTYLIVGLGFQAEQQRASPHGVFSYQKEGRALRLHTEEQMRKTA